MLFDIVSINTFSRCCTLSYFIKINHDNLNLMALETLTVEVMRVKQYL